MNVTWTEEEKMQLLKALESFGVNDFQALGRSIPTKTIPEIKYAMSLYEQKAIADMKEKERESANNQEMPIDKWLSFIHKTSNDSYKSADLATAIKFIALFNTEDENLRSAYLYIADLMMGVPPKPVNDEMMNLIGTAYEKLTQHIKHNMKKEQAFLDSITLDDILKKNKSKKILNDPVFNPLKIPAKLLKMEDDALI